MNNEQVKISSWQQTITIEYLNLTNLVRWKLSNRIILAKLTLSYKVWQMGFHLVKICYPTLFNNWLINLLFCQDDWLKLISVIGGLRWVHLSLKYTIQDSLQIYSGQEMQMTCGEWNNVSHWYILIEKNPDNFVFTFNVLISLLLTSNKEMIAGLPISAR